MGVLLPLPMHCLVGHAACTAMHLLVWPCYMAMLLAAEAGGQHAPESTPTRFESSLLAASARTQNITHQHLAAAASLCLAK